MALAGYFGQVSGATGVSVSFGPITMADYGTLPVRTQYQITDSTRRILDSAQALVIQTSPDNTTWTTQSASLYTVQWFGGIVTWNSQQGVGTFVRILSGYAFPMAPFAQFKEWNLDVDRALIDSTVFNSAGWKSYIYGIATATGSMAGFHIDGYFFTAVSTMPIIVYQFYTNLNNAAGSVHYDCATLIHKDKIKDAVAGAVDLSVDFTITGQMFVNNN